MPKGFGKIEHRVYEKMPPRIKNFWDGYHTTVKQLLIGVIVAAIAVIGVEAKNASKNASETADKARGEVQVIKQNSPCTPKENGEAERPKQCRESFSKAVQTLTPIQSCRILRKGATIILIGGQPIPSITCIVPDQDQRRDEKRSSQKQAESKDSSSKGSITDAQSESRTDPGGSRNGSNSPSDDGPSGSGPKGGSPGPDEPVGSPGSPGDDEEDSPASPENVEPEPSGNGGSVGGESPDSGSSDQGGVRVELLPKAGLPIKPEVCIENIINVNCNK